MNSIGRFQKRKLSDTGKSILTIGTGAAASCAATALFSALLAWAILKGWIRIELSGTGAYLIIGLSALLGCGICAKTSKKGKLTASVICGAVYYLVILTASMFIGKAGKGHFLYTAGIILPAALICGFLFSREKRSRYGT